MVERRKLDLKGGKGIKKPELGQSGKHIDRVKADIPGQPYWERIGIFTYKNYYKDQYLAVSYLWLLESQ